MFVNHDGEACFKILALGATDPLELVRSLHASAKEDLRSELTTTDDPSWSTSTFHLSFAGLKSKDRPVRAYIVAHRGQGLMAAQSSDLKHAFAGADAAIVRVGSDIEDSLATSKAMLSSGAFASDGIVVLEAPSAGPELADQARVRYAPRTTHVVSGESKPLDVLKVVIKAMLTREARKA